MTAIRKDQRLTPEQYLAQERAALEKSEYYDGFVRAMAGAKLAHVLIVSNIGGELRARLRGRGCRAVTQDLRLRPKGDSSYMYPDIIVYCGEAELEDDQFDTIQNPVVLFEVLSPSTETYDRGAKFRRYRTIETLQEYLLVSQDTVQVDHFTRQGELSVLRDYVGIDSTIHLSSLGVDLPLSEVYDGVTFAEVPSS